MKKLMILVSSYLLLTNNSYAENRNFEGFFTQASIGYEQNTFTNTGIMDNHYGQPTSATYFTGTDASSSNTAFVLSAGYYAALSNRFLLGVGFDYSVLKSKTSAPTYMNFNQIISGPISFEISGKRAVYLSPAVAVDEKSIVYGKLGLTQQNYKLNGNLASSTQVGGLIGVGYKRFMSSDLYAFVELNYYAYAETSKDLINTTTMDIVNMRPGASAYNALVGIGYKY